MFTRFHIWETQHDILLINHLKPACLEYFAENGIDSSHAIYGFHLPMFEDGHLHLNCLVPPFNDIVSEIKFREDTYPFITADHLIQKLRNGQRIKRMCQGQYRRKNLPAQQKLINAHRIHI